MGGKDEIRPKRWLYCRLGYFLAFKYPDILWAHVFFSPYAMFFWQKNPWNDTITSSSSVVQISSLLCTRRHMFGGMNPAYPLYPHHERKSMPYGCAHLKYLLEWLNASEIGTAVTSASRSGPVPVLSPSGLKPRTGPVPESFRNQGPRTRTAKNGKKPVVTGSVVNTLK